MQLKFKFSMIPMYFVVKADTCPCLMRKYFDMYQQKLYGLQSSIVQESKKLVYKNILPVINEKGKFIIQMESAQKNIQKIIDQITTFVESLDATLDTKVELQKVYIIGGKEKEWKIPKIEKKNTFPVQKCVCVQEKDDKDDKPTQNVLSEQKKLVGDKIDMLMYTMFFSSYCFNKEVKNNHEFIMTVPKGTKIKDPAQKLLQKFQNQVEKLEKDNKKTQDYYIWQGLEVGFIY